MSDKIPPLRLVGPGEASATNSETELHAQSIAAHMENAELLVEAIEGGDHRVEVDLVELVEQRLPAVSIELLRILYQADLIAIGGEDADIAGGLLQRKGSADLEVGVFFAIEG